MPAADPEVEVVLAAYDAFARGDAEAAVADMDPEVEWIRPLSFEMGGRRIGTAAVAEYLAASRAGWKHLTSEPTATMAISFAITFSVFFLTLLLLISFLKPTL